MRRFWKCFYWIIWDYQFSHHQTKFGQLRENGQVRIFSLNWLPTESHNQYQNVRLYLLRYKSVRDRANAIGQHENLAQANCCLGSIVNYFLHTKLFLVALVVIWVSCIFWLYKWKHAKPSAHEVNGRDKGSFHCVHGWLMFNASRDVSSKAGDFWQIEFKTESIRKLSNFNFQRTKTLYLNN